MKVLSMYPASHSFCACFSYFFNSGEFFAGSHECPYCISIKELHKSIKVVPEKYFSKLQGEAFKRRIFVLCFDWRCFCCHTESPFWTPISGNDIAPETGRMSNSALEELKLGPAALQKAGDDDPAGVVPQQELWRGRGEVASIYEAQQGGREQRTAAEIEHEIDERVELVLIDAGRDSPVDAGDGGGEVAFQQLLGLGLGDGESGVDVGTGVTVSDGPATGLVLVGSKLKAFELLGHGEARGAVGETQHGMLLWWILKFDQKCVFVNSDQR